MITGALNRGENVYAIGSVEGTTFIVCAVGADVVILGADFSRVQIIPGCSHQAEQLVSSVSCCQDSGKIAATYGNVIKVFEPTNAAYEKNKQASSHQWVETQCFTVKEQVNSVLWNMDGLRMTVVIGNELFLYQHRSLSVVSRSNTATPVMFCIAEEEQSSDSCTWDIVWSVQLAQHPKYIKFSPDGAFLAISGENDYLVKIFYQDSIEDTGERLSFSSLVLHHPAPVRGFEWRRTGRYMPRKCIQAVLMTWCEDNTSRIWKETPPHELAIIDLSGDGGEQSIERIKPRKVFGKHFRVKKARNKILNKLKGIVPERKRRNEEPLHALGLRAQIGKSPSFSDLQSAYHSYNNVQFHLTASINAETDCMLVPSMENGGVLQKPLCVHWLNNKELVFSIGAEKLLTEILQSESDLNRRSATVSPCEHPDGEDTVPSITVENSDRGEGATTLIGSICSETPSSKDMLDVKLEILLRQWSRSSDVLFTVHPVDGSLLTWTIEWLDDLQRQPVVSFTSRFPSAFPIIDASSLHPTLNTFNPFEPLYVDTFRREEGRDSEYPLNERLLERRISNTIHLLTNHENGSLNLWHMAVDEDSNFSTILNVTHMSRMCGHRFQVNQIVAHPVLPLLLTTSQFRSEEVVNKDDKRALSEVILWKISPVGPLCKSGGMKELSRVASSSRTGFDCLSWIPVILPSCTIGTVCNSPSSCFVASNGKNLVIYQAVVDARGFLAEIYNSTRRNMGENNEWSSSAPSFEKEPNVGLLQQFNVVSTQSTARPGCVLEVGEITDVLLPNSHLLLLHVFPEQLVINTPESIHADVSSCMEDVLDRSKSIVFNDRFFVVIVVREGEDEYFVTYSLAISSEQHQSDSETARQKDVLRWKSPFTPHLGKLSFTAEKISKQRVPLPDGVHIITAVPAAGHLPSSSLYPACQAPYVMITSCDDDVVRFWRSVESHELGQMYEWREWNMVSDNRPSELELDGSILSVSAAHSGRIACAYNSKAGCSLENVEVGVFECESSGGVEWMREDTFDLKSVRLPEMLSEFHAAARGTVANHSVPVHADLTPERSPTNCADPRGIVRLDWVSTEDGSHILTVGVGSIICMYSQVSLDPAQQNVALMKDSEITLRRPSLQKASSLVAQSRSQSRLSRWVCTRVLELHSSDGLPPVPTTLSWARDGLLIVGMQSEMRVYNQWNMQRKSTHDNKKRAEATAQVLSLAISQSHLMLDQLQKKKETPTNKSRFFIELMNKTATNKETNSQPSSILDAISAEGLFEAARLASPILPQYHPKQLIVLLNAGKTKRVKAILLHVLIALKQRQVSIHNPLSRAASMKRMSTVDALEEGLADGGQRRSISFDEDSPDYYEIDDIAPLPLYSLIAADVDCNIGLGEKAESFGRTDASDGYDSLFSMENLGDEELDEMLSRDEQTVRSRRVSISLGNRGPDVPVPTVFTAKHNRMLTELLTHTHLPGLSSVDQMHLLAIADTLSHFSADVVDKLTQANAASQGTSSPVLGHFSAGGYATAASGIETVDECGLRFLMAMKQHDYLLLCLPINQRMELKKNGLSSSDIIWAQHSETEIELLNAVPSLQKANPTWEELRCLGIAWWLKNSSSLKICIEKLAKAAFQQNQDPMDSSLYYLAMKKKNVLTHLFKTVRNSQMAEFFTQDFNTDRWKKVAAKNAFVLMSKQRFHHAAAFFLLSGSLRDALQTILRKCRDLQLAMVVLRLYETDIEVQQAMLKEILCGEVLGQTPDEFEETRGVVDDEISLPYGASRDPFLRSMTYWLLKDYTRSASTLVQEAHREGVHLRTSLSDIFNFYSFLRKHPLVVRQRIADSGAKVGSTEQFLIVAKCLETLVTPSERRLYFRTAAEHMAHGCPMLALDVLCRLPKNINMAKDGSLRTLLLEKNLLSAAPENASPSIGNDLFARNDGNDRAEALFERNDYNEKADSLFAISSSDSEDNAHALSDVEANNDDGKALDSEATGSPDVIAQHLKFVASLRIFTEELSTLASGFEVDGGHLRHQLLIWIEKEVEVLEKLCDYHPTTGHTVLPDDDGKTANENSETNQCGVFMDVAKNKARRWNWLISNQKLLRSFTSYCALHYAHNHRLSSALMELLLLLLEVQRDKGLHSDSIYNSFPLLIASVSSTKMFVSSPLSFIENQCYDLLTTIADLTVVPDTENHLQKAYKLYNLSQGLSSSLYQSLCENDQIVYSSTDVSTGVPLRRLVSCTDDIPVSSIPARWPGVENLIALLSREKDFEAPQLRQLLAECFVAVSMSLFCFALAVYDSRWLYRLAAHEMDALQFSLLFGGGGEKKVKSTPPVRPPRPRVRTPDSGSSPKPDGESLRAKFNTKVFGADVPSTVSVQTSSHPVEQILSQWVPPQKNIVQFFADKVLVHESPRPVADSSEKNAGEFDSDVESEGSVVSEFEEERCENAKPNSFAWELLRLALVEQQIYRIRQFLTLAGFDPSDVPAVAPRVESVLRLLDGWSMQLQQNLQSFCGGCPADLLPNMVVDDSLALTPRKYAMLTEKNNTPFESDDPRAGPLRRLWSYLTNQEHLQPIFIRHLFSNKGQQELPMERSDALADIENQPLPDAFKIIQKDNEPIVAFACNQEKPGWLVVSTGRELQEMDISGIFEESNNSSSWLYNRTELDVNLLSSRRDLSKENDDYQLLTENATQVIQAPKTATMIFKRTINGIRRIDSHPSAPFYVTGSSDGSVRVWEWGVGQPVYTARVAGQHAKVSKISFSCNGNKFAAVDGDGMLCLWQATHSTEHKKPFFSHRCHNKSASDVRFLGSSSSVLLTAGASSGEFNLALWDTLLPQSRALVHSWVAHTEGATVAMYIPNQQTIVSGGRHGELCLWDIRQRQLRATVKAFDYHQTVKTLVTDSAQDLIVAGSSDGDIKIWSADMNPQLMYSLPGEHAAKSGFSFRQVAQSTMQGVQQLYIDQQLRLFSCGADASLKFRTLPSLYNMTQLI